MKIGLEHQKLRNGQILLTLLLSMTIMLDKRIGNVKYKLFSLNFTYFLRYAYGWIGVDMWRQTLIKKDLEHPENYQTWFKESHYPGEMFFIPNPEGVEEDDGVLITVSFDGEREQSYVMLLDAKTFEVSVWGYKFF